MRLYRTRTLFPTLLAVAVACANPADDKPEAKVGDATERAEQMVAGERYVFEDDSSISWVGSKVTGSHDGGFHSFSGVITMPGEDLTKAVVEVDIDATTIWADNEKLTNHLKSADFFDVETHPEASFRSTKITRTADGYEVTGNLTLHGVTKSVSFPATLTKTLETVTAEAEFVVKRFDFGIAYKGKADDLIRDEVVIRLAITASHATA